MYLKEMTYYMVNDCKFCYVILHYQNMDITKECVKRLTKLSEVSPIIIVDNHSPNGSGEELKEHFKTNMRVKVIVSEKNGGFAKGNNIGFVYAKKNYCPDIIVVMNSDVFIEQNSFESEIAGFMQKNYVDVCGPDIITPHGEHQNPLARSVLSDKQIKREIISGHLKQFIFKSNALYKLHINLQRRIRKDINKHLPKNDEYNCVLHGSCVIYGKKYIKNENFAFLPITFLYGEEAILFDYLRHKSYRTGLAKEIKVYHLGGNSTQFDDDRSRYMFKLKNITKSYEMQLKLRKAKYDY